MKIDGTKLAIIYSTPEVGITSSNGGERAGRPFQEWGYPAANIAFLYPPTPEGEYCTLPKLKFVTKIVVGL